MSSELFRVTPATRSALVCAVGVAVAAQVGLGQVAQVSRSIFQVNQSSGVVRNDADAVHGPQVVYAEDVVVPGSGVVRLTFGEAILSGSVAAGTGSFITITSLSDGATQRLNAEHLAQWSGMSAYFNGPVLRVQLHAFAGTGENRLSIASAVVESEGPSPRTICGDTDDRLPSFDNRQGRFAGGCTAWVINDMNSSLLTAGHCGASSTSVMSFNVPLSTSTGGTQAAHPDDQYVVDITSNQGVSGGTGNDWRYIAVYPNSNHGQTPYQRYGVRHTLAPTAPPVAGQTIRITGYGTNAAPMPRERNQTQQTHTGAYASFSGTRVRYTADTTGGNSGSAVLDESTGLAIGIHTHGGCSSTGGSNIGTAIGHPDLQAAMANSLGLCASGRGTVAGDWYALGDRANNFGTVNPAPDNFARIAQVGAEWQGLAFSRALGQFYAINEQRQLFTLSMSGVPTLLGTVTGTSNILTGLAFNPITGDLFAMQPANGQLFRINTATRVASSVGTPQGGTLRALDFDSSRNTLWGIDQAGGTARLVQINPLNGVRTIIGALGTGIVSCADVAWSPADGSLRTINAATGELLAIDPLTGAATVLGNTGGVFGSAFGLASAASPACPVDLTGDQLVAIADIFQFLNFWFAGLPGADFDGVGGVTTSDVFAFLNAWFAGC